jgi:ATP-dependent Lon protease
MAAKGTLDRELQRRLVIAIAEGEIEAARLLVAGGADPDLDSRDPSLSPFFAACRAGTEAMRTWLHVSKVKDSWESVVSAVANACDNDCLPDSFRILVKNAPYGLLVLSSRELLCAAMTSPDHGLLAALLETGLEPGQGGDSSALKIAREQSLAGGEEWGRRLNLLQKARGRRDASMDSAYSERILEAEMARNPEAILSIIALPSFDEDAHRGASPRSRPVVETLLTMGKVSAAFKAFVNTPCRRGELERILNILGLPTRTRNEVIADGLRSMNTVKSKRGGRGASFLVKPSSVAKGNLSDEAAAALVRRITGVAKAAGPRPHADDPKAGRGKEPALSADELGDLLATLSDESDITHAIFDPDEIGAAIAKTAKMDKDLAQRILGSLETLRVSGPLRRLARCPDPSVLDELDRDFPHFCGPTTELRERLSLLRACEAKTGIAQALRLPNMLLSGPPGVGKTHYVHRLSELLGVDFHDEDMSRATAGFVLSGLDASWAGSKPGRVFTALADGKIANPLFFLDEIDKVGGGLKDQADGPLHALLERKASSRFRDEFSGVAIDASRAIWFAAANDLSAVKAPIRSRFSVHEIPSPNREQSMAIARSIYRQALADEGWSSIFDEEPAEEALEAMSSMPARDSRQALLRAFGKACKGGVSRLLSEHFPAAPAPKRSIGF